MAREKLDSIQVLRGVAALLVVLFHFRHYLNNVYPLKDLGDRLFLFGEAGVDLFFIISGFIIVYASRDKEKNTFLEFAVKRFFRLYPLYFFILTVYLVFYHDEVFTLTNIIKSYFLILIDYNNVGPWFGLSIIYSAWTLTYEAYFYFIFSLAILLSHKHRALICTLLIISIMVGTQLHVYGVWSLNLLPGKKDFSGFLYNFLFVSSPLVLDFIMGMGVAYFYIGYCKIKHKDYHTFLAFIILAISFIFMVSNVTKHIGPLTWGWCSAGIVFSVLIISKNLKVTYPRTLIYLGEMSYSIYINHVVVKKIAFSYIGPVGLFKNGDGFIILMSLLLVTLCVSWGTYNFVEKPAVNMGHKLAERLRLAKKKKAIQIEQPC